jgi:type I restriction enzyme S subunit
MRETKSHSVQMTTQGPGYKMTEVGEILEGWDVVRIGDNAICDVIGGSTPSTEVPEYWGGDIPWATPTDITSLRTNYIDKTTQYISAAGLKNSGANLIPSGSVLMTSRATIGYCAINLVPMATNQGFANLVCGPKVSSQFMLYLMLAHRSTLERLADGSTFGEVSKRTIRNLKVALPPLPEQRKIAAILSTVDENIQKTQQIIEKTEELKRGLMQQLLTRGIGHTRFKQTEIGDIPEEWEIKHLGELWTFIKAGISRPFKSENVGITVLRSNNVQSGSIDLSDLKYWYDPDPRGSDLSKITLRKYDVLVNFVNGSLKELGKAAIYLEEAKPCIVSTNFFIIRFNEAVDPFYINTFFQTYQYKKQIDAVGGFTGQGSFDTEDLSGVTMVRPPLTEQKEIVRILHGIDRKIENEKRQKHELEQLKKGLMQALLAGKVRVKVSEVTKYVR